MEDRRLDERKFSTQKIVTLIILFIFAAVTANVLIHDDQSERSMVLQTIINMAMIAVGYWLGASKPATEPRLEHPPKEPQQ